MLSCEFHDRLCLETVIDPRSSILPSFLLYHSLKYSVILKKKIIVINDKKKCCDM